MELFPDLSLRISPPNPNLHSIPRQAEAAAPTETLLFVDLNPTKVSSSGHRDTNQNYIQGFLGPKTPLYHQYHNQLMRSRFISRYRAKRSTRAPRMRWTTTLHARFARAVHLLGGHQRATPKSVLELMDVKDLTLAHVKSHLQMYRTVKTTGRAAASSGHYNVFDNGSSGDTSEDIMFDTQNPRFDASSVLSNDIIQDKDLCSSSRRQAWLHGKPKVSAPTNITILPISLDLQKDMINPKCMSYERIISDLSNKRPNLGFTLGRPL